MVDSWLLLLGAKRAYLNEVVESSFCGESTMHVASSANGWCGVTRKYMLSGSLVTGNECPRICWFSRALLREIPLMRLYFCLEVTRTCSFSAMVCEMHTFLHSMLGVPFMCVPVPQIFTKSRLVLLLEIVSVG